MAFGFFYRLTAYNRVVLPQTGMVHATDHSDLGRMKTKANNHTITLAAKLRTPDGTGDPKSFASGLLLGLGAASLMVAGQLPRPTIPLGGINDDWRAVRGDIEVATKKHGGKT